MLVVHLNVSAILVLDHYGILSTWSFVSMPLLLKYIVHITHAPEVKTTLLFAKLSTD